MKEMIQPSFKLSEARDNYYYLSVPANNDWEEIKILSYPKKKTHGNEFDNYVVSEDKDFLEITKKKIQEYFTEITYPQATNSEKPFYSVVVDYPSHIKTLHVRTSLSSEKAENFKHNNCFKNKEEAKIVVESLKKLLCI